MSVPNFSTVQFNCNDSGNGGGEPIEEDCECILRSLGVPCEPTDYMKDCAFPSGLDWGIYAPWQFVGCENTGGRAVASPGGIKLSSYLGAPLSGYSALIAGVKTTAPGYVGQLPDNQTLHIVNYSGLIINATQGYPIFGFAVNVDPTSTCINFTGIVLLFDTVNDRIILGAYTNANLKTGVMPTIIDTILTPIPNDLHEIVINNGTPSGGDIILEIFLIGDVTYEYKFYNPAIAPIGAQVGMGVVFVANLVAPIFPLIEHSAELLWDASTAVILRWNN